MVKINNFTEAFLNGLIEIELLLSLMSFNKVSFQEKGFAYFVEYKRKETIVSFLFGPSDWDVEIIVNTSKRKYAFKDLLQIKEIFKWVNENRYKQIGERDIKNELLWYVELLRFSLPFIE